MFRKITAVVLSVVLTAALAACGSGKKDPEKEKTESGKQYGVQCFRTVKDESGNLLESRVLNSEYKNLVKEATYTEFKGKEASAVTKWYYNDDGTVLLKKSEWKSGYDTVSKSTEYDSTGRKIRYSEKMENETGQSGEKFLLPAEYGGLGSDYPYKYMYFNIDRAAKELVTDYSYKGDTDKLASIKTVTDSGKVLAMVEYGDGDIVLSRMYEEVEQCRYEETYLAEENKGTWKYYNYYPTGEGEDKWDYVLWNSGEREYDGNGRLTREKTFSLNADKEQYVSSETTYTYNETGMLAETINFTENGSVSGKETITSDTEGRELKRVSVFVDPSDGKEKTEFISEKTYHTNGNPASSYGEQYNRELDKLCPTSYYEYNENGEETVYRTYDEKGQLQQERITDYRTEANVAGRVRNRVVTDYTGDEVSGKRETYEVCLHSALGEDTWVIYREIDTNARGKASEAKLDAEFDPEGHLIKVNTDYVNGVVEFDTQGRITRETVQNDLGICEYSYEYWEGEDNNPSGNTN